jgi:hypothetical protein
VPCNNISMLGFNLYTYREDCHLTLLLAFTSSF